MLGHASDEPHAPFWCLRSGRQRASVEAPGVDSVGPSEWLRRPVVDADEANELAEESLARGDVAVVAADHLVLEDRRERLDPVDPIRA